MHKIIATLVWILLTVPSVTAADFEKGLEAFNRDDFATALQEWRQLAEQGDAAAQSNLGIM